MIRVADDRAVDPEQVEHGSAHAAGPERRERFTDLAFRDHGRRPECKLRQNCLARPDLLLSLLLWDPRIYRQRPYGPSIPEPGQDSWV